MGVLKVVIQTKYKTSVLDVQPTLCPSHCTALEWAGAAA